MNQPTQKAFFGNIINRCLDFFKTLIGDHRLSKKFRKMLSIHGDKLVSGISLFRAPLDTVSKTFLSLITAGKWSDIQKEGGIDKFFHTGCILHLNDGTNLFLEKTAIPVLRELGPEQDNPDKETSEVSVDKEITLSDFIQKTIDRMGKPYYTYDGLKNNCQDFQMNHLRANGLGSSDNFKFLDQGEQSKYMIENTPSLSQWLGNKITDIAGTGESLYSELVDKRGGRVMITGVGMTRRIPRRRF